MRIGIGVDTHQLVSGRPFILGGVTIPSEKGPLGHSDADVLTHSIMDAILGALALGTIGDFFPDTDPNYKDADSMQLLTEVVKRMSAEGYMIGNVDTMVIVESPKLAPHIVAMRDRLSEVLHTTREQVSIKGTRSEQMGFIGRGEGITAHAVVLLNKSDD
ncbi:2-C-methyl-D-erythritol 2,4-cyclodiphosphate synthase [Candidatus Marinamargulisbacteria bacterium SCGC AG-439-L15]|nr:2-C-methyl-D-erythritol 2,4-cyclodiphosphate synthase [Candidatus Marinamargulisbacteria bacterium SCGC AG-439-L15]